jgi:hypothetical protein
MSKVLRDITEIRQWAEARSGNPMMMDVPEPGGRSRALLQITFGQHALNAENNEGPDRPVPGFELVSWDDWGAELNNQKLAVKVKDEVAGSLDNDFEFISAEGGGETTDAARQPPTAATEPANAGNNARG